jgi:O-antigen ligase
VPAVVAWAAVIILRFGVEAFVTASMMAAAATAPMNGVRIPGNVTLTDAFLVIAGLGLIWIRLAGGERMHPLPPLLTKGLGMIIVGGLIGTLFAGNAVASLGNLARFSVSASVSVLVVFAWRPPIEVIYRYAWCWLAGATVSCLVALVDSGTARPPGLTTHPNHLAIVSSLGAGVAVALAAHMQRARRAMAIGLICLFALTVVRSGSRAGLLALGVTFLFLAVRMTISRTVVLICTLTVLGSALLASGIVHVGKHDAIGRLLGDETSAESDRGRKPALEKNLQRIRDHPITGEGFEVVLEAHNIYVQAWSSAGMLGLAGLLTVAWATVSAAVPRRGAIREGPATEMGLPLLMGFAAGYIGYLAAGVFQNILWDRYLWLQVALVVWLGVVVRKGPPAYRLSQQTDSCA